MVQPAVPHLQKLIKHAVFQKELQKLDCMKEAGKERARMDVTLCKKSKTLRVLRGFLPGADGKLHDPVAKKHSPLVFAFVQKLMNGEGGSAQHSQMALQKMVEQMPHCDSHARNPEPLLAAQEKHITATLSGDHAIAFTTSSSVPTLEHRFKTVTYESGQRQYYANKVSFAQTDDVVLIERGGQFPVQVFILYSARCSRAAVFS